MKIKFLIIFILIELVSKSVFASENKKVFTLGMDFGGDTLAEVTYTNGSKSTIKAGNGLIFSGGYVFNLSESQSYLSSIQAIVGLKYSTIQEATNADVTWTRWPLEILYNYHFLPINLRTSAGLAYVIGNSLEGSGVASVISQSFKPALGYVLQVEYMWGQVMGLGARYMIINFESDKYAYKANANAIGINFSFYFGNSTESSKSTKL